MEYVKGPKAFRFHTPYPSNAGLNPIFLEESIVSPMQLPGNGSELTPDLFLRIFESKALIKI